MLTYFRKNQQQLITGILVIFLGGWLSLVCQHCQAYAAVDNDSPSKVSEDHCKQEPAPPEDSSTNNQLLENDCLGSCDEDNNNIIAVDGLQTTADKISKTYQPDIFFFNKRQSATTYSPLLISLNGGSSVFERACFLPLDRFCVQLK